MEFKDQIKHLADRVIKLKSQIQTEEAAKNAFVMPFLQTLGFDVFNPTEVVPEYVTDIGTKKGEKIDYAIFKDNNPVILVECKHHSHNLSLFDGQLLRYFHVSKAKFGLLTNGIVYRFYSDLETPNKMDEKPFLEFNITEIKDNHIEQLKKFHKNTFDVNSILSSAADLKYTNDLRHQISQEFSAPSSDFVKHFARKVYPGLITAKVLDQFTNLTKLSIQQHINDIITERLKTALDKEDQVAKQTDAAQAAVLQADPKVVTTEEELEAYMIVKTILRQKVDPVRITYRDAQTYCAILLDDNNRKTICRLYFNGAKKFVVHFDEHKKEVKTEIENLNEIFKLDKQLISAIERFSNG